VQLIKLGSVRHFPDLSEYYVIWDLDMIALRPLHPLTDENPPRIVLNIGGRVNRGYEEAYKRLTGFNARRAPDGSSFVTHWTTGKTCILAPHLLFRLFHLFPFVIIIGILRGGFDYRQCTSRS